MKKIYKFTFFLISFLFILSVFFFITLFFSNPSNGNNKINYTYEEALMLGEISNCNFIIDIAKQNICKNKLGDCSSDECIYSEALESSNRNKCYSINNKNLRLKCSFETFKTKIFDSAVLNDNITICEEIIENIFNQRCKDNFYFVKSLNTNKISFCDKIIQLDLKGGCYNENN